MKTVALLSIFLMTFENAHAVNGKPGVDCLNINGPYVYVGNNQPTPNPVLIFMTESCEELTVAAFMNQALRPNFEVEELDEADQCAGVDGFCTEMKSSADKWTVSTYFKPKRSNRSTLMRQEVISQHPTEKKELIHEVLVPGRGKTERYRLRRGNVVPQK